MRLHAHGNTPTNTSLYMRMYDHGVPLTNIPIYMHLHTHGIPPTTSNIYIFILTKIRLTLNIIYGIHFYDRINTVLMYR